MYYAACTYDLKASQLCEVMDRNLSDRHPLERLIHLVSGFTGELK